jgi:membrane protease subunit (stomatin/prohibitin family)
LRPEAARFGLDLIDFYVQGLDVVGSDPAFKAVKESLANAAALRLRAAAASDVGSFYQLERSLDALNLAAANEGGPAGALLAGGLGVGLGLGVGQKMSDSINQASRADPENQSTSSPNDIALRLQRLQSLLEAGLIAKEDYESRKLKILDEI